MAVCVFWRFTSCTRHAYYALDSTVAGLAGGGGLAAVAERSRVSSQSAVSGRLPRSAANRECIAGHHWGAIAGHRVACIER